MINVTQLSTTAADTLFINAERLVNSTVTRRICQMFDDNLLTPCATALVMCRTFLQRSIYATARLYTKPITTLSING